MTGSRLAAKAPARGSLCCGCTKSRPAGYLVYTDGALSISYKATVQEDPDAAYVVQLRRHGNVASMNLLINYISKMADSRLLPLAPSFPIPGERERQLSTGFGIQVTQFVPGRMASSTYPELPFDQRLVLVRRMALAFQACWDIKLPDPPMIGELVATQVDGDTVLSVGPDRHHNMGGPFTSVRHYLQAYIQASFLALEKQQGIDEFKIQYLERLKNFSENCLDKIPALVDEVPIVPVHSDMGPHNIIVSAQDYTRIEAIIDWEFVASAPFMAVAPMLEMFFRRFADNGHGPEYDGADALRQAFWDAIPAWKKQYESESVREFLVWFRFALYMKPEWRPKDLPEAQHRDYWKHNIEAVQHMLEKYS